MTDTAPDGDLHILPSLSSLTPGHAAQALCQPLPCCIAQACACHRGRSALDEGVRAALDIIDTLTALAKEPTCAAAMSSSVNRLETCLHTYLLASKSTYLSGRSAPHIPLNSLRQSQLLSQQGQVASSHAQPVW